MNAPRPPNPRARAATWLALICLAGAGIVAALMMAGRPALTGAALTTTLIFAGLAGLSAWLGRAGRNTLSGGLLIGGLALLAPAWSLTIADIGLWGGLILAVGAAVLARLTLSHRATRAAVIVGLTAGTLTLLIDLFFDQFAPWQRVQLTPLVRDVYIPLVAAGMLGVLGLYLLQQFPQFRLSTKLLLGFLSVALVPLTLISLRNEQEARATLRVAANQALLGGAAQTAAELDAFITANLATVAAQGRLAVLGDYLHLSIADRFESPLEAQVKTLMAAALRQTMALPGLEMAQDLPSFQAFWLLDAQGQVAVSTAPVSRRDLFEKSPVFIQPWESGQPQVSPVLYTWTPRGALYFSAPVEDTQQVPVGVLVAQVDVAWLQRLVARSNNLLGAQSASFAALLDENGLRLADGTRPASDVPRYATLPDAATVARLDMQGRLPPLTAAALEAQLPEVDLARQQVAAGQSPTFFAGPVHCAGDSAEPQPQHLAVAVRLRAQPWIVIFAQPESVALAPLQAQTRATLLLALLFVAGVAAASALAARGLAQPINQLTRAAERVRAGDLSAYTPPVSTDEIGQLTGTFNAMTAQLRQTLSELEQRVTERTAQLQAAADIGRATAGIRDLDELLDLAVELIRGRFGFYHASVFLMDDAGEYAVLRESTGEIGAQLKARGHRLAVGSRSLVGWVTQNRALRVARDVAGDPFHFKNPLLPETRSELCLPLLVGGRLLGALDVQSRERDAFSETDQQALQVLADQLGIAIDNARLFRQTQSALAEAEARHQQTLEVSWRETLLTQARERQFDLEPGGAVSAAPLQIPLRLRDQVIGLIELHGGPSANQLAAEEQAVLETVAAQLSTALESAALMQESLSRSRRDQLITTITDEMRASLNPTVILQNSIRQLGRALGATEITVRLAGGLPEDTGQPEEVR